VQRPALVGHRQGSVDLTVVVMTHMLDETCNGLQQGSAMIPINIESLAPKRASDDLIGVVLDRYVG
jgi:hypothetical protein